MIYHVLDLIKYLVFKIKECKCLCFSENFINISFLIIKFEINYFVGYEILSG